MMMLPYNEFMSLRARSTLLDRARATVAAGPPKRTRCDDAILRLCEEFIELEARKVRVLGKVDGYDSCADLALSKICASQADKIESMCELESRTLTGQRARAFAYVLWDSGALSFRTEVGGELEDTVLLALVRDLTG